MPPGVSERKKAARRMMVKIRILDKLHLGISYGDDGHEFHVNKSTTHIK